MHEIKSVAIIGMGALGLLYASAIEKNAPEVKLAFITDEARAKRDRGSVQVINGEEKAFTVLSAREAKPVDLLIVAVKYPGLAQALDTMQNAVSAGTIVLSVLNGVTSEAIIAQRYPMARVLHCVAQGMDAVKLGNTLTYSHSGQLRIGCISRALRLALTQTEAFLQHAGISYVEEENIRYRMWSKFMLNVGVNQVCMVFNATYGSMFTNAEAERTLYAAFREAIAIANAEGVQLTEQDIRDYVALMKSLDPDGMPSMRQDRINQKPSEVEMFAGAMIQLGQKHDIAVPTNAWLYQQVRDIEAAYSKD